MRSASRSAGKVFPDAIAEIAARQTAETFVERADDLLQRLCFGFALGQMLPALPFGVFACLGACHLHLTLADQRLLEPGERLRHGADLVVAFLAADVAVELAVGHILGGERKTRERREEPFHDRARCKRDHDENAEPHGRKQQGYLKRAGIEFRRQQAFDHEKFVGAHGYRSGIGARGAVGARKIGNCHAVPGKRGRGKAEGGAVEIGQMPGVVETDDAAILGDHRRARRAAGDVALGQDGSDDFVADLEEHHALRRAELEDRYGEIDGAAIAVRLDLETGKRGGCRIVGRLCDIGDGLRKHHTEAGLAPGVGLQVFGKCIALLVGIDDEAVHIGDEQVAEGRNLQVAGDFSLRLFMARIVEAARARRLEELFALVGRVRVLRDEDVLQFGAGIARRLLYGLPAAAQAGDRHLQRFDARDRVRLGPDLLQRVLEHVAAKDQHALLCPQRLCVRHAAAGDIGKRRQHAERNQRQQKKGRDDLEGKGLKSFHHGMTLGEPSGRVFSMGRLCAVRAISKESPCRGKSGHPPPEIRY